MQRCQICATTTENPPVARYYDTVNPTDATFETLCDRCQEPREAPADYAMPFGDEEDEG